MTESGKETVFHNYVHENLSPKKTQRDKITTRYEQLNVALGEDKIFQTGSYARKTAIDPVHDLDTIYVFGSGSTNTEVEWEEEIEKLVAQIDSAFKNQVTITKQPRSIRLELEGDDFSVDIVPALELDETNEDGDPIYLIPEVARISPHNRALWYESRQKTGKPIDSLKTDPRGYKSQVKKLDESTEKRFRKIVKFVKAWRHGCKEINDDFALKSFHSEQILAKICSQDSSRNSLSIVSEFFEKMENYLSIPQFPDRADSSRYIDEYVAGVSDDKRKEILTESSVALKHLSTIAEASNDKDVETILSRVVRRTSNTDSPKNQHSSRPSYSSSDRGVYFACN